MSNAAILLLSLAVVACASAPGYRAPEVQVPAAFRETSDTTIAVPIADTAVAAPGLVGTGFWPEVGDTTLTRLLNEAAKANLDVRAAEARVRAARSARTQVALDFAPTVTFAAGYTR